MEVTVNPEVNVLLKVCKQKDETIDRADALISELRGKIESKNWDIFNLKRQVDESQLIAYEELLKEKNQYAEWLRISDINYKNAVNYKKKWKYRILEWFTEGLVIMGIIFCAGVCIGWLLL